MEMKSGPTGDQPGPRSSSRAMNNMFTGLAGRYDLANRVMSLGRDLFWRRALARRVRVVDRPGRLLDLAAGTGDQIVAIKKMHPHMEVIGLDLSAAMMELAAPKLARLTPPIPEMIVGDALAPPFGEAGFDSISISFGLRNIPARGDLYAQVLRMLKPGGRFLVLEMYHDRRTLLAPVVSFYLRRVAPVLGGRLISGRPEAYQYLASSILGFPQPEDLTAEMTGAGFTAPNIQKFNFNTVMLVTAEKPRPA